MTPPYNNRCQYYCRDSKLQYLTWAIVSIMFAAAQFRMIMQVMGRNYIASINVSHGIIHGITRALHNPALAGQFIQSRIQTL